MDVQQSCSAFLSRCLLPSIEDLGGRVYEGKAPRRNYLPDVSALNPGRLYLGLKIAQRRSYLHTVGPNVGIVYIVQIVR